MPSHQFEHLPLILRNTGPARLTGGGEADPATLANRENRGAHSGGLVSGATTISDEWRTQQQKRSEESLPDIEGGIPLLATLTEMTLGTAATRSRSWLM